LRNLSNRLSRFSQFSPTNIALVCAIEGQRFDKKLQKKKSMSDDVFDFRAITDKRPSPGDFSAAGARVVVNPPLPADNDYAFCNKASVK
jgi:hypothetical protein